MPDNATFDFGNQRNRQSTAFAQSVDQQVLLLIALGCAGECRANNLTDRRNIRISFGANQQPSHWHREGGRSRENRLADHIDMPMVSAATTTEHIELTQPGFTLAVAFG